MQGFTYVFKEFPHLHQQPPYSPDRVKQKPPYSPHGVKQKNPYSPDRVKQKPPYSPHGVKQKNPHSPDGAKRKRTHRQRPQVKKTKKRRHLNFYCAFPKPQSKERFTV